MSLSVDDLTRRASTALDVAARTTRDLVRSGRRYLASEQGRAVRRKMATVVIIGAPIVSELPVIRRHPVARLLRTASLATLLIKGAEWVRDWEPGYGPNA